jgi:Fe-S-cluster-containing dehydrogenase component
MKKLSKDNSCPGCLDCGDKCDVWDGYHLWVDFHRNLDGTGEYSKCEFCGKTIEYGE